MNRPAILHPDHLLDRARGDGLDPEGWRQLGGHLASCRACAWEQAATADFARERAADGLEAMDLDRLVEGALARAGVTAPPALPAEEARPRARRVRPKKTLFERHAVLLARCLAAAAMVALAVGAALALPGRAAHEGARQAMAAPTEANLDAGAAGAVAGDDS